MRSATFKTSLGLRSNFCRGGFTCHHQREVKSFLDWLTMHLVWQCCETDIFLVLVLKIQTKINAHMHAFFVDITVKKGERRISTWWANTDKLISSFTKLPTCKHLNSQQLSESKIQWYHLRASNTNCSTWATPEAAKFSVTHWINQSEILNTLQHRSCLSPRFLGETLPRYLIIAVRVKSTPGALGPGGTDGGRYLKLHTSALWQTGVWP